MHCLLSISSLFRVTLVKRVQDRSAFTALHWFCHQCTFPRGMSIPILLSSLSVFIRSKRTCHHSALKLSQTLSRLSTLALWLTIFVRTRPSFPSIHPYGQRKLYGNEFTHSNRPSGTHWFDHRFGWELQQLLLLLLLQETGGVQSAFPPNSWIRSLLLLSHYIPSPRQYSCFLLLLIRSPQSHFSFLQWCFLLQTSNPLLARTFTHR